MSVYKQQTCIWCVYKAQLNFKNSLEAHVLLWIIFYVMEYMFCCGVYFVMDDMFCCWVYVLLWSILSTVFCYCSSFRSLSCLWCQNLINFSDRKVKHWRSKLLPSFFVFPVGKYESNMLMVPSVVSVCIYDSRITEKIFHWTALTGWSS
jgi:hypothetical protein